jgi:hypothetical protein
MANDEALQQALDHDLARRDGERAPHAPRPIVAGLTVHLDVTPARWCAPPAELAAGLTRLIQVANVTELRATRQKLYAEVSFLASTPLDPAGIEALRFSIRQEVEQAMTAVREQVR